VPAGEELVAYCRGRFSVMSDEAVAFLDPAMPNPRAAIARQARVPGSGTEAARATTVKPKPPGAYVIELRPESMSSVMARARGVRKTDSDPG
jgi:hypothetical protein